MLVPLLYIVLQFPIFPRSDVSTNSSFFIIQGEMSNLKTATLGNSIENPDQPSPISVLELPYEEDDNATPASSGNIYIYLYIYVI